MSQAVITVSRISPNSSFNQNTIDYYFNLAVAAGDYTVGGIPFSFAPYAQAPGAPLKVEAFSFSSPVSAYTYRYNQNCLLNAVITNLALTSNVATITANNNFKTGQVVTLSGLTTSTFLNGKQVTVISTGLSHTQFEFNYTHANVSTGAETGTANAGPASQLTGGLQIFSAGTELSAGALAAAVVADDIVCIAKFLRG